MTRWLLLLMLSGGVVGAGCDRGNKNQSSGPVIAVIPKGTSHVFWQSVHAGANRAARELGIPTPLWQGPPDEARLNDQMNIVENVLTRGVDAVVLAPINFEGLDRTIEKIHATKPVIIFDSGCRTQQFTSFIATDNYKGGQLAGAEMLRLLGPQGGEIAIVRVQAGSESTTRREEGFLEVIRKSSNVKVVFEQYGESNVNTSYARASDALVRFPSLKGFYGPNESSTVGILKALKDKNLQGKVQFVGFDSSEELARGLEEGHIHALVLQDPVRMGYLSVKAAYAALQKQPVPKEQPIEPKLITPQNMKEPQMQQLLRPDLSKDL